MFDIPPFPSSPSPSPSCDTIKNFYECARVDATELTGLFGGKYFRYLVPQKDGITLVECNLGLDTLGFARVSINSKNCENKRVFHAIDISPIDANGNVRIQTLFSQVTISLPKAL